jgi:hypothetical protein
VTPIHDHALAQFSYLAGDPDLAPKMIRDPSQVANGDGEEFDPTDLRVARPDVFPAPTRHCQLCRRELAGGCWYSYGLRNGKTAWVCTSCSRLIAMRPPNNWDPASIGKTSAEIYAEAGNVQPRDASA